MRDFKTVKAPSPVPGRRPKDSTVIEQAKQFRPVIFGGIRRSKNQNVVIYEVNLDSTGRVNQKNPVSHYWLDVDPAYRKKRKSGSDYLGLSTKSFPDNIWNYQVKNLSTYSFELSFTRVPTYTFQVKVEGQKARMFYQGQEVTSMYIDAKETLNPFKVARAFMKFEKYVKEVSLRKINQSHLILLENK